MLVGRERRIEGVRQGRNNERMGRITKRQYKTITLKLGYHLLA